MAPIKGFTYKYINIYVVEWGVSTLFDTKNKSES